jgi:hypothetical protein
MGFFSESSSLYFFSALLQANAAILSIFAIFVIFRIQSLTSSIDTRKFVLGSDSHVSPHDINSFEIMSVQSKKSEVDHKMGRNASGVAHYQAWITYEEKIEKLRRTIIIPTSVLAASILFFAIALSLAHSIHRLGVIVEAIVLVGSIALEALCLALVLSFSFSLIGMGAQMDGLSRAEKVILRITKIKR